MKASVIIPAFNEEAGISETLKAIQAQDHPDFEIIVVDNASTDKTAEVARSFTGVKVVREDNKGTMWACERGRKEATGEVIVRMDADCLPDKDWLTRGMDYFQDPEIAVVSGPYDYFDAKKGFAPLALFIQRYIFAGLHSILQAVRGGGITMGGNTFMRSSALQSAGGFNTSIIFYGDDTDIPKRLSEFGQCIYDPDLIMKTSARRFHKDGIIRLQARYTYHFFKVIFTG